MPKKKQKTVIENADKNPCVLLSPQVQPNGAVKLPPLKLACLPFGLLVDKFRLFFKMAVVYGGLISLLSFVFGYSYVCTLGMPSALFCNMTDGFYPVYLLLKYVLLFLFAVSWYHTVLNNQPLSLKNMFYFNRDSLTAMGILAMFFVLNLTPLLAFYLLWIRVPNPDVTVEVAYFALISTGFLVPFVIMRFYSVFGFAADGCRLPSLKEVWERSRGNLLKILVALFLIFFLALFIFFNLFLNVRGYEESSSLWGTVSTEFVYDFLLLLLITLFINHCFAQKLFLYGEAADERNN